MIKDFVSFGIVVFDLVDLVVVVVNDDDDDVVGLDGLLDGDDTVKLFGWEKRSYLSWKNK